VLPIHLHPPFAFIPLVFGARGGRRVPRLRRPQAHAAQSKAWARCTRRIPGARCPRHICRARRKRRTAGARRRRILTPHLRRGVRRTPSIRRRRVPWAPGRSSRTGPRRSHASPVPVFSVGIAVGPRERESVHPALNAHRAEAVDPSTSSGSVIGRKRGGEVGFNTPNEGGRDSRISTIQAIPNNRRHPAHHV
jgi:hypothetical protein